MATVALNLTKEALSLYKLPQTDRYSQIAVKRYIAGGRLGTYTQLNKLL